MWWTGQTSKKYILPHLPNAISPPEEHALYKDNFATGNVACVQTSPISFASRGARKMEKAKEIGDVYTQASGNGELSKVIADIAQGDGNVLFLFYEH